MTQRASPGSKRSLCPNESFNFDKGGALSRSKVHAAQEIGETRIGPQAVVPRMNLQRSQSDRTNLVILFERRENLLRVSEPAVKTNENVRVDRMFGLTLF